MTKELLDDVNQKYDQFYREFGDFRDIKNRMDTNVERLYNLDTELSTRDLQVQDLQR